MTTPAPAPRPRVRIQPRARTGEVITIRTLISHEMESGQRRDNSGNPIPRRIINKFVVTFEGQPVFTADLEPAIAANPYVEFKVRVTQTGAFRFAWHDDNGQVYTHEERITVA